MSQMHECSQVIHYTVVVLLIEMPNHQYTYLLCPGIINKVPISHKIHNDNNNQSDKQFNNTTI